MMLHRACFASFIALTTLSALPLQAASPTLTTTIRVRHARASQLAAQLLSSSRKDGRGTVPSDLPFLPGVQSLSADDKAGCLKVQGDKEGIGRLQQLVSLLDQSPSEVRLRATLSTAPYQADDSVSPRTTPLAATEVRVSNTDTVKIPLGAAGVAVQCVVNAHINADRTVTLSFGTDSRWRDGQPAAALANQLKTTSIRRIKQGETHRVLLILAERLPGQVGPRPQYYLELTPVAIKVP